MRFFTQHTSGVSDEEARKSFYRPKTLVRLVAVVAVVAGLVLLTAPQFHVGPVDFEPGQNVSWTIRAAFPFDVEDKEKRISLLEERVAAVKTVYTYDKRGAVDKVMAKIRSLIDAVGRFEDANQGKPAEERESYEKLAYEILRKVGANLTSSTVQLLSREILSNRFKDPIEKVFRRIYEERTVVEQEYKADRKAGRVQFGPGETNSPPANKLLPAALLEHPKATRAVLDEYLTRFYAFSETPGEEELRAALLNLAVPLVEYSLWRNDRETERRRNAVRVPPQYKAFARREVIVHAGDEPDELRIAALREYRSQIRYFRAMRYGAYAMVMFAMLLFLVFYARRFRPELRFRTSTIVIVGIPLLVVLFMGRLWMYLLADQYAPDAAGYLFPAALLGMLGVILLDTNLALILVLMGSVLIGLATDMSLAHAVPALFGGLTAVAALHRLRQRGQLFIASIYVSAVQVLTIGVLRFIQDPTQIYYSAAILGTVNGALSYLLAIGMFPLFERLFGITTDLRLLELTGINHRLLREVEERAPGTYQHCLNVAKLGEAAAEAIGANYLLVRAGAYFHDVGKSLKPRYFSENQISAEERRTHEKLTPYMSCLIIRNHVKEGIELARRNGIPERVVDFIPQHHGTCLIKFFYHEAVRQYEESESAEPVRESDFRYPGPKPQTIEAAIVMVADSVEATATSRLNRPRIDEDDIRRLVNDAIQDKFSDGQFDECHLTLRQLYEIRESMVRTLVGRFHHRIEYPAAAPTAGKKASKEPAAA